MNEKSDFFRAQVNILMIEMVLTENSEKNPVPDRFKPTILRDLVRCSDH